MESCNKISNESHRGKFREATVDLIAGSLGNMLKLLK